ncbi:hypothetical protein BKA93DRAFT_777768 [Sparassis latifolia]
MRWRCGTGIEMAGLCLGGQYCGPRMCFLCILDVFCSLLPSCRTTSFSTSLELLHIMGLLFYWCNYVQSSAFCMMR